MTIAKKILHLIEGVSISLIATWAVDYLFGLANITVYSTNSSSLILLISVVAISILIYWLTRSLYPYVAKGVLVGICLSTLATLLGIWINSGISG